MKFTLGKKKNSKCSQIFCWKITKFARGEKEKPNKGLDAREL
jgi:hypothetical protein